MDRSIPSPLMESAYRKNKIKKEELKIWKVEDRVGLWGGWLGNDIGHSP